jgi:hypothetical protein
LHPGQPAVEETGRLLGLAIAQPEKPAQFSRLLAAQLGQQLEAREKRERRRDEQ